MKHYCQEKILLIEKELDLLVQESTLPYGDLFKAARYSLLSTGGKRLRPILLMATTEVLGGSIANALRPACALEMIHTYSLIHDDLPCMDNDDYRRGQPTLHKVYPEWHALLTGDYLLTYAFEVMASAPNLSSEQSLSLVRLLAKSSGSAGMIGGQLFHLSVVGKDLTLENLKFLHKLKTGALLTASIIAGSIVAGASESVQKTLQSFGEKVGLAFQIIDDVIDVTSSVEKHGHKVSSDEINDKATYVTLLGVDGSKNAAKELLGSAKQDLQSLPFDTAILAGLADLLVNRNI